MIEAVIGDSIERDRYWDSGLSETPKIGNIKEFVIEAISKANNVYKHVRLSWMPHQIKIPQEGSPRESIIMAAAQTVKTYRQVVDIKGAQSGRAIQMAAQKEAHLKQPYFTDHPEDRATVVFIGNGLMNYVEPEISAVKPSRGAELEAVRAKMEAVMHEGLEVLPQDERERAESIRGEYLESGAYLAVSARLNH